MVLSCFCASNLFCKPAMAYLFRVRALSKAQIVARQVCKFPSNWRRWVPVFRVQVLLVGPGWRSVHPWVPHVTRPELQGVVTPKALCLGGPPVLMPEDRGDFMRMPANCGSEKK